MRLSFLRVTAGLAVAVVLFSCVNQTSQPTSTQTLSQVKLVAVNGGVQATLVSTAEAEKAAGRQLCYVGSINEVGKNIATQRGVPTLIGTANCASAALNSNAGNYVATVAFPDGVDRGFFAVVDGSKRVEVLTQLRKNATSVTRNLMLAGANPYDIDDISTTGNLLSFDGSYTAVRAIPTQASSNQVAQAFPLVPSALEEDDFNYLMNTAGPNQEYAAITVYNYNKDPFSVVGCANNSIVNARVAYVVEGEIADAYNTSPSNLTLLVIAPTGLSLVQANCSAALSGSGATSSVVQQVNTNPYYDGILSPNLQYAYMMRSSDSHQYQLVAVNIKDAQETPLAQFTAGDGDATIALLGMARRPSQNDVAYAVLQNKAGKEGQALLRFSGAKLEVFTGASLAKRTFTADTNLQLDPGLPESLFQIQGQTESIVAQATRDAPVTTYTYQAGKLTAGTSQEASGVLKYVSLDGETSYMFSEKRGLSTLSASVVLSPSLWVEQAVLTSKQEVYARSQGAIFRNGTLVSGIQGATGLTGNAADAYVVNAGNLYQVTAGQIAKTWSVGGDAVAVTVSNAGTAVAAVIKGNVMTLVDTSTGATTPVTLTASGPVFGVASFEDAFAVKQGSTITAVDVKGNQTTVATEVIGVGLGESADGQTSAIVVTATTVDVYSSANAFTKSKTISLPLNAVDALSGESDVKVAVGPRGNISISTSAYDIEVYTDGTAAVSARKKPASTSSAAVAPIAKTTIVAVWQLDAEKGNAYQLQYVAKAN